ncbi:MAG: tetratricopeptide repeat protein [Sulfurimonas sp.]
MIKIILLLSLVFTLYAGDELSDAFANKNYQKAFTLLQKASDNGDVNAKYNLALMYYRGDGTKQDIPKSLELLEVAAKQGNEKALQNIGRVYMQIIKFDKAIYWLEKNAKQGDKNAYYLLAEIYCSQEKFALAKKWANKSIKSGNVESKILYKECQLDKY